MLKDRRFHLAIAFVAFISLFYFAYRFENITDDSIDVKFEKSFMIKDGFHFRVTNASTMDMNSLKITIDDKFVNYPHAILFRNGFIVAATDKFAGPGDASYTPKKGDTANILIECIAADGRHLRSVKSVRYE